MLVLAQHGERKLSMSDVSTAAGVSRPTLYRYYPTRDELLRALADHEQRRFDEGLARAIAGARSKRDRLDAALHQIVMFLDREYAGRRVIDVDPVFILNHLAAVLPAQRRALERSLGDALAVVPAVRSGATTAGDFAELLLRVAMSYYLLPHRDPDALLASMRAIAGIKPERAA
jgi:AcrR family transcriptional regulator